jgi:hypothetical protein
MIARKGLKGDGWDPRKNSFSWRHTEKAAKSLKYKYPMAQVQIVHLAHNGK